MGVGNYQAFGDSCLGVQKFTSYESPYSIFLAACRTEALRLNAESDFAVAGFRLALDRTLIPV